MASTGLEVFDRTLHITHIWLDEIMAEIGPDRQRAWHVQAVFEELAATVQGQVEVTHLVTGYAIEQGDVVAGGEGVGSQLERKEPLSPDPDDGPPWPTGKATLQQPLFPK